MDCSFLQKFFHFHEWRETDPDHRFCKECDAGQRRVTRQGGVDFAGGAPEPYIRRRWEDIQEVG